MTPDVKNELKALTLWAWNPVTRFSKMLRQLLSLYQESGTENLASEWIQIYLECGCKRTRVDVGNREEEE